MTERNTGQPRDTLREGLLAPSIEQRLPITGDLEIRLRFRATDQSVILDLVRSIASTKINGLSYAKLLEVKFKEGKDELETGEAKSALKITKKLARSSEFLALAHIAGIPDISTEHTLILENTSANVNVPKAKRLRLDYPGHLSQTEVGIIVARSQGFISDLEGGKRAFISLDVALKLSHLFKVELDEILSDPSQIEQAKILFASLEIPSYKKEDPQTQKEMKTEL